MLEELKKIVRDAETKSVAYFDHAITDEIRFLAKHGEKLIAAVELAENAFIREDVCDHGPYTEALCEEEDILAYRRAKENTDAKS